MAIQKNEDGLYTVSFGKRHPITRQAVTLRRKGFKSLAEAKRAYNDLVIEVDRKIKQTIIPTWSNFLDAVLAANLQRDISKKTSYGYDLSLRKHTLELWGNKSVDEITTSEIRELIEVKLRQSKPTNKKYVLKGIRLAFAIAVEKNLISRNPTPIMKLNSGDKIKLALTEPQVKILLERARQQGWFWYHHYCLALYLGMRSGELYSLTFDKVDTKNRKILIDRSWNNKDGFKSTKSGDDRIVEIPRPLISVLQELKLLSGGSQFVLPRHTQWDRGEQAKELRKFCESIGLPQIRFHDLRATWATLLLSKGVDQVTVMKMGGWKDLKTLMRYVRKAGVDIQGSTDCLELHDPQIKGGKVLKFDSGCDLL